MIKKLLDEEKSLEGRLKAVRTAITVLQGVCGHDGTVWIGNNHNDEVYRCLQCEKVIYL